jgi:hypothetical protein
MPHRDILQLPVVQRAQTFQFRNCNKLGRTHRRERRHRRREPLGQEEAEVAHMPMGKKHRKKRKKQRKRMHRRARNHIRCWTRNMPKIGLSAFVGFRPICVNGKK